MIFGVWLECTLQWEWQQSGFGVYTPSWSVHSVRVRVWSGSVMVYFGPMSQNHFMRNITGYSQTQGLRWDRCTYQNAWWRHQMETFSALLAICAGNSPRKFPEQRPVTRNFDVSICSRINGRVNDGEAGDLRRLLAHYDVTVMVCLISVGATVKCRPMWSISPYPSGLLNSEWEIVRLPKCQWSNLEWYRSPDWHRSNMMTWSNWNIFRVTGPLWLESTDHRWIPLTKFNDTEMWCFFDLRLDKRLSKQSRRRWFETPWHPLWRLCTECKHGGPCA